MIHQLTLTSAFQAIPYLATSPLWLALEGRPLALSTEKPNVLVGANGAGKTALLKLLSLQTLTHFTGQSSLDNRYLTSRGAVKWWTERTWSTEPQYLPGAQFETDQAPAVFYRPGHVPGNETSVAAAMMAGYFDEAKVFDANTKKLSTGQGCRNLLQPVMQLLRGESSIDGYQYTNWSHGRESREIAKRGWVGEWEYQAEVLKRRVAACQPGARPMVLMDEPEQSLDAKAELQLWRAIANCDHSRVQVVVATHSLYPFLHPEHFHIIEATPGYVASVREELVGASLS